MKRRSWKPCCRHWKERSVSLHFHFVWDFVYQRWRPNIPEGRGVLGLDKDTEVNGGSVLMLRVDLAAANQVELDNVEKLALVTHGLENLSLGPLGLYTTSAANYLKKLAHRCNEPSPGRPV